MSHAHPRPPESGRPKTTTQMISIGVGFALFCLGLCGILWPAFAGLHLGAVHSIIIAVSGATIFYNGYNDNSWNAFLCCLGFALFFGLHSIIGFLAGSPGVPSVGYESVDPSLLRIIPNVTELGHRDHTLNGIIGLILFGGAMDWFGKHSERSIKRHMVRKNPSASRDLAHQ